MHYMTVLSLRHTRMLLLLTYLKLLRQTNFIPHQVLVTILFVNMCLSVRLNFKGKCKMVAMTCESTRPTLDATPHFCTIVHSTLHRNNCEKCSTMIRVTEGQITLARSL